MNLIDRKNAQKAIAEKLYQEQMDLRAAWKKNQAASLLEERKLPDILVKHSPTFKPLKPFKP